MKFNEELSLAKVRSEGFILTSQNVLHKLGKIHKIPPSNHSLFSAKILSPLDLKLSMSVSVITKPKITFRRLIQTNYKILI